MFFGDYRVEVIPDCEFRLDGGAMFGVVPRNLWSRVHPPDDQNRIRMNMNCLFIEADGERILIDTGIGEKWSEKHRAMYGHNRSMQCARLAREGKTLFGFADLVPTRAHVPYAWVMGYDLYPLETVEAKKKLLPQAAQENWTCLFYHDPDQALCRIIEKNGKFHSVTI